MIDTARLLFSLPTVQEPVYSLAELQSMLDGMIKDFTAPQPEPGGFYTGGGASPLGRPSSQQRSAASSRVHPQGFGDAACFSRTAFSR